MVICYYAKGGFDSLMMSYCVNDIVSFFTCLLIIYKPYRNPQYYIDRFILNFSEKAIEVEMIEVKPIEDIP